jgi:hypothetical protein
MMGQIAQFLNYYVIPLSKTVNVPTIYSSWKYDICIQGLVFIRHASSPIVFPPINNHVYFIMFYLSLRPPFASENENT